MHPIETRRRFVLTAGLAATMALTLGACAAPDADLATGAPAQLTTSATTLRLRVATFNTHLTPPAAYDEAGTALPTNWSGYAATARNAELIAKRILSHRADHDVIVFNEVFDADTQDVLIEKLAPTFPYWIVAIDGHVRNPFYEDSGLAIFSRYPLAPLDEANQFDDWWHARSWRGVIGCGPGAMFHGATDCPAEFAFRPYEACDGDDCKSRKGVGLVRVEREGHRTSIAFTHMQADYPERGESYPEVRERQLQTIAALLRDYVPSALDSAHEDVVVLGDLNVEGWVGARDFGGSTAAAPNPAMRAAEYGQRIWGNLDGRPFFDAWRTTSPEDQGITHRSAGYGLGRLDYALVYGSGYHVADAPTLSGPAFLGGEHQQRCVQWVHRTLAEAPSDHIGVAIELGPRGPACRPDLAVRPTFGPGGAFVDVVRLAAPGQVKWYRVDEPGTFSIGFLRDEYPLGEVVVEVFPASDLAHRIASVDGAPMLRLTPPAALCDVALGRAADECEFITETFFPGNAPFYVRVSAPTGLITGDVPIAIFRHDCSTEALKCWLRPGDAPRVEVGDPTQHTFFYGIRTHEAIDHAAQTLEVEVNGTADPVAITLGSPGRGEVQPELVSRRWRGAFAEDQDQDYLLRVRRVGGQPFDVAWRTDLTFVFGGSRGAYPARPGTSVAPLRLYCADETEGDALGSDEILLRLGTPSGVEHFGDFWPEVNASDTLSFDSMKPLAAVGPVRVTIAELSSETYSAELDDWDDLVTFDIAPLDPHVLDHLGQVIETPLYDHEAGQIDWTDAYGAYQLTFNQSHSPGGGQP